MPILQTSTLSNQNISSALLVGTYTATRELSSVMVVVMADQVAGNGDYTVYLTRQLAGAGSAYKSAVTTVPLATGVTALYASTIQIPLNNTDVLKVYLAGLAGDTTTPDVTVEFWDLGYLRPTVAGRTLDVTATGGAGIDWANVENPTTTLDLSGTSTKALQPTVAGRTLDVTATGAAGIDWGNLENPTTTNALTNTSISATGVTATVAISATQAASVASGNLAIVAYATWGQAITSTSTLALPGTKLWLAVKNSTADADAASIVFIERTAGLTVLNGAAYTGSAGDGSLTLSGSSGAYTVTCRLEETATALLTGLDQRYVYELKALVSGDTYILSTGYCDISTGVVRAIT